MLSRSFLCCPRYQRSHNLRKFPQIYALFIGVVLVIMRILCIFFKNLLLSHLQLPYPYRNKDVEISYESTAQYSDALTLSIIFTSSEVSWIHINLFLLVFFIKCCHGSFGISYPVGSMCIYHCRIISWSTRGESLSIFVHCVLYCPCEYCMLFVYFYLQLWPSAMWGRLYGMDL